MAAICAAREPSFRLPSFRLPETTASSDQEHLERRQLFLRSYLFSREPPKEKAKEGDRLRSELRAACRLRRLIWRRLRRYFGARRRNFPPRHARPAPPAVAYFSSRPAPAVSKRRLSDFIPM